MKRLFFVPLQVFEIQKCTKGQKYKALILKYVPYILKYMACIFHDKPYVFFAMRKGNKK